jgi:hypothetical protein
MKRKRDTKGKKGRKKGERGRGRERHTGTQEGRQDGGAKDGG